jgi:hypothetical protein
MPGISKSDQSLVPSLIDGIAIKTVETRTPMANAIPSILFMMRASPLRSLPLSITIAAMSDLEKARKIVAKRDSYVGKHGAMLENIATAVAEGIALGRKEGLELAAKLIADKIKETG